MMLRSVFTKTIYDKRFFILGWFLGFAALAALLVTFFPAMKQEGSLEMFVDSMPPAMQGFVGDLDNLRQLSTYLAAQLFDIRMQIIAGIMVVVLALKLTVGEEESGQLRTVLSLPISRTSLLVQKWLAMVCITGLALSGTAVGIYVAQFAIDESISLLVLGQLMLMTWIVMVTFATVTFAAAIASGSRALATIVGILLLTTSFVITTFAIGVDWLRSFEAASLFYYFPAVEIAKSSIALRDVAVLSAVSVVALVVAFVCFRRRDVQ